ncbi:hypothetical protein ACWD9X_43510, partial [Streptomyces sp. NPDC005075]
VYTVSEMLDLRYGGRAGLISGVVMWAYTLMRHGGGVRARRSYGTAPQLRERRGWRRAARTVRHWVNRGSHFAW